MQFPNHPNEEGEVSANKLQRRESRTRKLTLSMSLPQYKIRPDLPEKFRPGIVQELIEKVVREKLEGLTYDSEEMPKLVKVVTEAIQAAMRELEYSRYKLVTCVILGERRGEGISSATRCIWDSESDCMATYTFLSETVFCCATVYGIYFY